MIEGAGSGSISLTNGSGCGSGRPKTYGSYGSGSATLLVSYPIYLVLTCRKLGTVLEVSRDAVRNPTEGSSGPTVFTVKTLLGELTQKAVWIIKIRGKVQ
jgi:hypothetical protein